MRGDPVSPLRYSPVFFVVVVVFFNFVAVSVLIYALKLKAQLIISFSFSGSQVSLDFSKKGRWISLSNVGTIL